MALRLGIGTIVAVACAAAVWTLPVGSTFGRPGAIQLKLGQGRFAVSAPTSTALAGKAQSVTVTVIDARGTGAGWALTAVAARPISIARIVARCAANSTCTLPRASRVGPIPLVLRAANGSGMGVMQLTVTLAPLGSGAPATRVKFSLAR